MNNPLEREPNATLFDRSTRSVRLTDAGTAPAQVAAGTVDSGFSRLPVRRSSPGASSWEPEGRPRPAHVLEDRMSPYSVRQVRRTEHRGPRPRRRPDQP